MVVGRCLTPHFNQKDHVTIAVWLSELASPFPSFGSTSSKTDKIKLHATFHFFIIEKEMSSLNQDINTGGAELMQTRIIDKKEYIQ